MKKTLSKLLSILIAFILVFAVGCTSTPTATTTPAGSTAESAVPTETAEPADPFGKIEPGVEISAVRQATPEQTVKYTNGDSDDNNIWTRTYEEKLGIKLNYLWKTPYNDNAQYTQKLNMSIATGDLPDVFLVDMEGKTQLKQLIEADQIQDLSEAFEKYASPNLRSILTESGPEPMATSTYDGKLMGIPWTTLFKENVFFLYVRADWMEKLNLSDPQSMQDVLDISEAFTKQDPDGNNKDDTFGMVFENTYEFHRGFFNSFHAYPGVWVKDDSGKLAYGDIQPEMKNALLKLQELYKDGQIDKEFITKDLVKAVEALTTGKAGMFYGPFSIPAWPLQEAKNLDPNVEYNYYPLQSIDSEPATPQYSVSGILGYWVVKKGNPQHAEALIKMLNLFVENFYFGDSSSVAMTYGPEGETWQCAFARTYRDYNNLDMRNKIVDIMKGTKTLDVLTDSWKAIYNDLQKFVKDGDNTQWGMANIYTEDSSLEVIQYYKDTDLFKMDEFYGPPTDEMVSKSGPLKKLRDEAFTNIIMGASIDEFDKFVTEWKKQGGDKITEQVNEWYDSRN